MGRMSIARLWTGGARSRTAAVSAVPLMALAVAASPSALAGSVAARGASAAGSGLTAQAWGFGADGELGDGALGAAARPVSVRGLTNVVQVSAGGHHSLALLGNGTVMAWGQNDFGQLGTGQRSSTPQESPVPVNGLSGVVSVSAGDGQSLALLRNGTVMAWGQNAFGQLGIGKSSQFAAVPVLVSGLTQVKSVVAANKDSFAVLADGTVMGWGSDIQGQIGDGVDFRLDLSPVKVVGLPPAVAVAAGGAHTLALTRSGQVYTWGFAPDGENGDGSTTSRDNPGRVPGLANVTSISATQGADFAVTGGRVMAWGSFIAGDLGRRMQADALRPIMVSGLTGVRSLSSGDTFTLALLGRGALAGWGDNTFGEMAAAVAGSEAPTPVLIPGVSGVRSFSAGGEHALALASSQATGRPVGPRAFNFRVVPYPFDRQQPLQGLGFHVTAVSAASAKDAWALLLSDVNTHAFAHWNGSRWQTVPFAAVPDNGFVTWGGFYDVGPSDAWAVGTNSTDQQGGPTLTLIEHWDGTTWHVVPSPDPVPASLGANFLSAVTGSGPDNIWAAGREFRNGTGGGRESFLLAHFDGTRWSAVTVPAGGAIGLTVGGVAVASRSDAWAVMTGQTLVGSNYVRSITALHWNGTTWGKVRVPRVGPQNADESDIATGVAIASHNDVWVSAYLNDGLRHLNVPYLLHFNGREFAKVAVPLPGGAPLDPENLGTTLNAIAALGPSDIYAVGSAFYNDAASLAFVRHFNGRSWSTVPVPQPGDGGELSEAPMSTLLGVSAVASGPGAGRRGAGTVFLVGDQGDPLESLATAPLVMISGG